METIVHSVSVVRDPVITSGKKGEKTIIIQKVKTRDPVSLKQKH